MSGWRRASRLGVLIVASFGACVTSWRFERVEGERPSIHPDMWNEINCAGIEAKNEKNAACFAATAPYVHCATAPELCRRPPGGLGAPAVDDAGCGALRTVLGFVHLSDARLREHRVLVGKGQRRAELNAALDMLQRHDDAVLLSTVLAANQLGASEAPLGACPAPSRPRFAIHTGDAVGTGVFSELLQFIAAMDQLLYPWFNVIGDNDAHFFGHAANETVEGLNVVLPYVPIVDSDRFMRFHSVRAAEQDPSLPSLKARSADHRPSLLGNAQVEGTSFHGFDFPCAGEQYANRGLCPRARGYYAFYASFDEPGGSPRRARIVVLNTAEELRDDAKPVSSGGRMLPEQVRWLEQEISRADARTYVLVFGHHPLAVLSGERGQHVRDLLIGSPRVLAYFSGHAQTDAARAHAREAGPALWELGAGSTFAFPQLAREVELLAASDGSLYLRLVSFRQALAPAPGLDADVAEARGNSLDSCQLLAQGTSFCRRLAERTRRGRAGAEGSAETRIREEAAILQANGMVLVHAPCRGGNRCP